MESPFVGTEALRAKRVTEHELPSFVHTYLPQRLSASWSRAKRRKPCRCCLALVGQEAVVAGNSAAALLGAKWVDAQAPAELISDRKRPPPLIITRNETLLAGETVGVNGIPVTSPSRTVFDLGRRPGLQIAVVRIDALARATGVTVDEAEALIDLHRGARGIKQLRKSSHSSTPVPNHRRRRGRGC